MKLNFRSYFLTLALTVACLLGSIGLQHSFADQPPGTRKPLIGIASLTDANYVRAIRESGAIPVVLPNTDGSPAAIDDYLEKLDGLLMPGGPDIPPSEWNEEPHPTVKLLDDDRFRFEKALVSAWIKRTKKPLLGICLGSQWINVAHGGSLVQDIPSEFNVNHRDTRHQVTLEADSKLAAIFGETNFEVNSFHHQAVRNLGTGLRIVAKSPEGIVEATESTDPQRFLIGVQWHPEKMFEAEARQRKLFTAFVDAAGAREVPGKLKSVSNATMTFAPGNLPIILTAPHGGKNEVPGVPERVGKGVDRFVAKTDAETAQLTEALADSIEKQTGQRPYVVIARFHRKYIDANRRPEEAYERDDAKASYDAYHEAIAAARRDVIDRWGSGILIDIHGQGMTPNTIYRGTQNGKTTTHLIKRFGKESQIGPKSLGGELASQGFNVIPPVDSHDKEEDYSGGHTVITYGSESGGTMDAIQLELGPHLRSPEERPATTEKMTNAILAFAKSYLPTAEKKAAKEHEKITIGVYIDTGAGPSSKDLLKALSNFKQVSVKQLTAEQIRGDGLAGLDILMHPGGSGGGQGRNLEELGREKIRAFVREGGGYVGICAGAYLATAHYPWSLNILDAKVVDTQHWKRGIADVEIELTPDGQKILDAKKPQFSIHYANGPLLAPADRPDIEDYEEMARFKSEIAENGAPAGVMTGATAIARGRFGKGRVMCFSPHPEMTEGLESFVQDAINHVIQRAPYKN